MPTAPSFYPLTGAITMSDQETSDTTPRIAVMIVAGQIVAAKSSIPMNLVVCNTDAIGKKDKLTAARLWQSEQAKLKHTPGDGDPANTDT